MPKDYKQKNLHVKIMWDELPEEERKQREDDYSKAIEKWNIEMKEWREKYGDQLPQRGRPRK